MSKVLLEIVTPDKLLLSKEVDEVICPGADGDFGVLARYVAGVGFAARRTRLLRTARLLHTVGSVGAVGTIASSRSGFVGIVLAHIEGLRRPAARGS